MRSLGADRVPVLIQPEEEGSLEGSPRLEANLWEGISSGWGTPAWWLLLVVLVQTLECLRFRSRRELVVAARVSQRDCQRIRAIARRLELSQGEFRTSERNAPVAPQGLPVRPPVKRRRLNSRASQSVKLVPATAVVHHIYIKHYFRTMN